MNKSALLGFVFGVILIAFLAAGYYLASGIDKMKEAAVEGSEGRRPVLSAKKEPGVSLKKPPLKPVKPEQTRLVMVRAANSKAYQPGGQVDITVNLVANGDDPIRALGMKETLPDGWTFEKVVSEARPDLTPKQGGAGELEFAWFNVPKFPTSFTYRVNVDAKARGDQAIAGEALYRTGGPELRFGPVTLPLKEGAPATPATAAAAPTPVVEEKPEAAPVAVADENSMKLSRSAGENNTYVPGNPLPVSVSLDYSAGEKVSALAVIENLPEGWSFNQVEDGEKPAVSPKPGQTGKLEFIWINVPAWPATFLYSVNVPDGETAVRQISGNVAFRATGPEVNSQTTVTDLSPAS